MPCTTILVGKNAACDGSTLIARNDDSPSGSFAPKRLAVLRPGEPGTKYTSVISHVEIDLPETSLRCTAVPNALPGRGVWAAGGVNSENVAMTATETITTNARVLGADPLVEYRPAAGPEPQRPGGIGEEDIVLLVLPYIHSARDGVKRLGSLLEKFGTYESNGIAFQDVHEIWWLESVGGHHWIARRVPDDVCVVMPNQLGIDSFDLADALGAAAEHMCSPDLAEFIENNHLCPPTRGKFNPRTVFGSHTDSDHVYNTPRAWYLGRRLAPRGFKWDGPDADFTPESDDIPWSFVPESPLSVEEVKYLLSSHYQGTPYDPYGSGDPAMRGAYRSIGVNRNNFLDIIQLRPYAPEGFRAVEWLSFGSCTFSALVPFYSNVDAVPQYLSNTGEYPSTDSFYWTSRLISALADSHYGKCIPHIERYQLAVQSKGRELIGKYDRELAAAPSGVQGGELREKANGEIADMLRLEAQRALDKVLYEASCLMKNAYSRSDS